MKVSKAISFPVRIKVNGDIYKTVTECSKCGTTDYPPHKRKKVRGGKKVTSYSSFCVICHNEDQKIREERRYKKKLEYNRKWCMKNREKKNESDRRWYRKKKGWHDVVEGPVEWHMKSSGTGMSRLTYTPLWVHGGR
jgi:hypothetical protein